MQIRELLITGLRGLGIFWILECLGALPVIFGSYWALLMAAAGSSVPMLNFVFCLLVYIVCMAAGLWLVFAAGRIESYLHGPISGDPSEREQVRVQKIDVLRGILLLLALHQGFRAIDSLRNVTRLVGYADLSRFGAELVGWMVQGVVLLALAVFVALRAGRISTWLENRDVSCGTMSGS